MRRWKRQDKRTHMAETHDSNQDEPGKAPLPRHKADPAFTAEFTKAVEAYGKAASAGQTEQAEAAALQMLSLAGEEAEHNPSPELLLTEQARVCEERGAWGDAEALYRKLLAMAGASDEASHTKHGQIFQAHRHLCNLFLLLGEYAKAGESAAAALVAARAAELSPLLIWALDLNAYCALRLQDRPSALAMAAEAVRTVEPGPLYDTLRAGAWVSRARCRVLAGDDDLAEQDLLASQPILFGKGLFDMAAGLHSRAASWWEVRASLCERRGDWSDALEAWTRAVECRRHVASLPHVQSPHTLAALARTLLRLGAALREHGDEQEAGRILTEGSNIWQELGLPAQEAL